MEVDPIVQDEVVIDTPLRLEGHPLALDLQQRCSILLQDLGIISSSTPRLPVAIAQVIFDYAFTADHTGSVSALLAALSELLAVDGVSSKVVRAFGPILPDLLARWLGKGVGLDAEIMESQLSTVAFLSSLRPDLWK
jgi:hypothetical protein